MTSTAPLWLAELVAWNPATGTTTTLRYASGSFTTRPSETPANTFFDARLAQPVNIKRDIFAAGSTSGRNRVGYGDLILLNPDGELDALLTYGFDGRAITIRRGTAGAAYPSGFTTVFIGTMEQAEAVGDTIVLKVRDRQRELQVPLQPNKYAGTNSLPNGLEGVESDLKGKPRPILYGIANNVPAVCVNTSKLIFQVNDGPISVLSACYDAGIQLSGGLFYDDVADLLNDGLAPAAGQVGVCASAGYIRLGSSPAGQVTCDVVEPNSGTVGMIMAVLRRAGFTESDWSVSDLGLLPAPLVGYWTTDEVTVADALDEILGGIGAWWGVNKDGIFRFQQLTAPSGTPVLNITANDLLRPLARLAVTDDTRGLPVWKTIVRYARNFTVQTGGDLAAAVADDRRVFLGTEWREATAQDGAVLAAHPLAPQTVEESLLRNVEDAQAEANRRQTMRGQHRDRFELVLQLNDETETLDLGDVIRLTHSRYGLSGGRLFRIIGVDPDARARTLGLTAWGPEDPICLMRLAVPMLAGTGTVT